MFPEDCSRWLTSRSRVDRAGEQYRSDPTDYSALRQVQCYRLFRLLGMDIALDEVCEVAASEDSIVSARLKRLPTIVRKLDRFETMCLSQLADVVGVRIVCSSLFEAKRIAADLRKSELFKRELDYWSSPQETGYRGSHIILRARQTAENSETTLTVEFEVQVRTYYQHLWALVSETFGEQVKEGSGPDDVREYLVSLSRQFEDWEEHNKNVSQTDLPAVTDSKKIVVVRINKDGQLQTLSFEQRYSSAFKQLIHWEEDLSDGRVETLLLVGVGGGKLLGWTHASFLGKTTIPLPTWCLRYEG